MNNNNTNMLIAGFILGMVLSSFKANLLFKMKGPSREEMITKILAIEDYDQGRVSPSEGMIDIFKKNFSSRNHLGKNQNARNELVDNFVLENEKELQKLDQNEVVLRTKIYERLDDFELYQYLQSLNYGKKKIKGEELHSLKSENLASAAIRMELMKKFQRKLNESVNVSSAAH